MNAHFGVIAISPSRNLIWLQENHRILISGWWNARKHSDRIAHEQLLTWIQDNSALSVLMLKAMPMSAWSPTLEKDLSHIRGVNWDKKNQSHTTCKWLKLHTEIKWLHLGFAEWVIMEATHGNFRDATGIYSKRFRCLIWNSLLFHLVKCANIENCQLVRCHLFSLFSALPLTLALANTKKSQFSVAACLVLTSEE